ncbi:MAG TPA: Maf family protein [Ilumatobacteraceae bacterium]
MTRIVLASSSARRHELLQQIGVAFEIRVPDINESPLAGESPADYVRRLAFAKAAAVDAGDDELVIAADTTVELGGEIFAKPADATEAAAMLRRLSARTHRVHTGVAVRRDGVEHAEVCTTLVTFVPLDERTIEWYVGTGEPMGKAGAYALQGAGGALVRLVRGSVSNVIGLPLHVLVELAERCGVALVSADTAVATSPRCE